VPVVEGVSGSGAESGSGREAERQWGREWSAVALYQSVLEGGRVVRCM